MDIVGKTQQIACVSDHVSLVAPAEDWTAPLEAFVEVPCIPLAHLFHIAGDGIWFMLTQNQVKMIGHKGQGKHGYGKGPLCLEQKFQEKSIVAISVEDLRPIDAAIPDVQDCIREW
jgi:hypothetical protein